MRITYTNGTVEEVPHICTMPGCQTTAGCQCRRVRWTPTAAIIIPTLVTLLTLAGCQTTDDAIRRNLTLACTAVEVAHGVFTDIAASVRLNASTLKLETSAHDDAAKLCANPGTNTQDVTVAVLRLSVKIGLAVAEAKRAKDAVTP